MASLALTDRTVRSLKSVRAKKTYVWDGKIGGLGVRIWPSGKKTFVLKYRFQGHQRMVTLGAYPALSLGEARNKALAILGEARQGEDPRLAGLEPLKTGRFAEALEAYIDKHCAVATRERTRQEVERVLRREFLPTWGNRDVSEIEKRDVVAILDGIMGRGAPSAANHAFTYVKHFFNWLVARGVIEVSPCHGLMAPAPKRARERALSDAELARVWAALDKASEWPFQTIVRLLILTGQRRGEVTGMRWEHVDLDEKSWTLPAEFTKNKREHVVPLTALAVSSLEQAPRLSDTLVFPARGRNDRAFSGWSKSKRRLDAASGVTGWTLHDIRRTVATGMARLGVAPHVVERVLNHTSGTFAGVAGVYNRFGYLPEMREALEKWERHVLGLVTDK